MLFITLLSISIIISACGIKKPYPFETDGDNTVSTKGGPYVVAKETIEVTANPDYDDESPFGVMQDSLTVARYAYDDEGKAVFEFDFEIRDGQEIPISYKEIECDNRGNPVRTTEYDVSNLGDGLEHCEIENVYDENGNLVEYTENCKPLEINSNAYSLNVSRQFDEDNHLIYEQVVSGGTEILEETSTIDLDQSGRILKKVFTSYEGDTEISYEYIRLSEYRKHHVETLEGTSWDVISGMDQGSTLKFTDYEMILDDGNQSEEFFYKIDLPCHLFVDKNDGEGEQHHVFFNYYENGHDYLLLIMKGIPLDYIILEKR